MRNRAFVKLQKELLLFIAVFFGISLLIYWLMNGGAYFKEITYDLFHQNDQTALIPDPDPIPNQPVLNLSHEAHPQASASRIPTPSRVPALTQGQYLLSLPQINTGAPIVIPREDAMKEILASMEKGVALYPGSSLPGQTGRAVVLGHSSRASWYRGNYATVFALLSKLEIGDLFYVTEGHKRYVFEVFDKQKLLPADTDALLAGPSEQSEIDLITCYPIGSASKRLIIRARLTLTQQL